jgi:predicted MPP superfamily phosphohydrolase
MNYIVFVSVFLTVMAAINFYVYRRFLRKLTPAFSRYAMVLPLLLMLGEVVYMLDALTNMIAGHPWVYLLASASVGISFMLFVVATVYDLTVTAAARVPFDQTRRRSIKILFDVTMLVAAVSYVLRGLSQGLKAPALNTVHVDIPDFPAPEYRIVQLTDIHVGRIIRREFIQHLVDRSNALAPDMVVITGDLIDLPVEEIRHDLAPLRELQAPAYFILGNHEYFHGAEAALETVTQLGIRTLTNESLRIETGHSGFNLVGVNDLIGERMGELPPDFEAAYQGVDNGRPTIVLAHQPKSIERVAEYRCDLMISGHTHGGQIFPFGFLVMIDQPYLYGLHRHSEDQQIFVSRGTGFWGPPLRVLAPSEISHIVIRPA